MGLSTLTIHEWRERFRGVIRTLITTASTVRGEDYEITSRMMAMLAHSAQGAAVYALRQILPSKADAEWLVHHANERRLPRLEAAKAIGLAQIDNALSGAALPAGSTLHATDGTEFTTAGSVTATLPAWSGKTVGSGSMRLRVVMLPNVTGVLPNHIVSIVTSAGTEKRAVRAVLTGINAIDFYEPLAAAPTPGTAINPIAGVVVPLAAVEAGARGNREWGELLTIASLPANLGNPVRVLRMSGGGDGETDAELRGRVQDFDAGRPAAGNDEFWRAHARETPNVRLADAFVFPGFRGLGTIDVIPFGVSGSRLVGNDVIGLVQAHLDALKSYDDDLVVRPAGTGPEVAIQITVHVHPDFRPDFDEDIGVSGHPVTPSTTTRLYLTADPNDPISPIEIGDRIMVAVLVGARWKLEQRVVSAAVTGAPSYVEVSEPFSAAPGLSASVQPGGPLGQSVIDAIASVYDNLGPAVYKSIVANQYELYYQRTPSPAVAYDGTLRATMFQEAILGLDGVGEAEITSFNGDTTAPFADVNPAPMAIAYQGVTIVRWNTLGLG